MHWSKRWNARLTAVALVATMLAAEIAPAAWSQTQMGAVKGTVQDESGRPLTGLGVFIQNKAAGTEYAKNSGPQGQFEFRDVSPGNYVFEISPAGPLVRSPLSIQVQPGATLNVQLVVAQAGTSTPSAQGTGATREAPAVSQSSVGGQISESQLAGLPLNGRSYNQLATLQGSMVDPLGGNAQRGGGSGSLTVSGGRSSSNTFLMDGTNIMDTGNQVPRSAGGVQLGSDTVLQVQADGVQYSAEYGRGSGGVLNSLTRSGGEEFHANLFEFFRNSKMDARNFFDRKDQPDDPRIPPFKRNQFGFTATGPIVPKNTFFMAGMEVMRDRLTVTDTSNVIDPAHVTDVVANPDPRVLAVLKYYVPVNAGYVRDGIGRVSARIFLPTNEMFFTGRVDHRITDRDSLFVRYNFDDATSHGVQDVSYFRTRSESRQQYLTVVGSHIFSPRAITSFRLGYTRPVSHQQTVSNLEIPRNLFFVPTAPQFGVLQVAGASAFGPNSSLPQGDVMNSFQFSGDMILQRGPHNLKLGAEAHRYRWDGFTSANLAGIWGFSSLESFLTLERDLPATATGATSLTVALPGSDTAKAYRQTLLGFYAQDEYRVRPTLQLSLGLRYEFATLIHDRLGRTAFLPDPLHDTELQVGPLLKSNPSLRNFSPRVGLSWAPTGRASTNVSAGLGIYYDEILEYVVDSRGLSQPFYKSVFIPNLRAYDYFPNAVAAVAAQPGSPKQALIMDYNNMSTPMVLRFNASLRQQLPAGTRLTVAYVGARGNHLYRAYELNQIPQPITRPDGSTFFPDNCNDPDPNYKPTAWCQPGAGPLNPNFGSINVLASDAQSFYHSLQLSVNKPFARGNTLTVNYTLSKSVDDASSFATVNQGIQYGPLRTVDRALSDFDIRNRLTASFFYGLPFGSQGVLWKSGALGRMFGGWRIGGILSARSGTPISLRINVRDEHFLFAARRPNLKPGHDSNTIHGVTEGCEGVTAGIPIGTPDLWYDPCAFTVPEAGTLGNNGRNTMHGMGSFTLDANFQRDFLLDSKRRLQFRAEVFNVANKANFRPFSGGSTIVYQGSPTRPRVNPTAGRVVSTSTTARQIQFALRLSF